MSLKVMLWIKLQSECQVRLKGTAQKRTWQQCCIFETALHYYRQYISITASGSQLNGTHYCAHQGSSNMTTFRTSIDAHILFVLSNWLVNIAHQRPLPGNCACHWADLFCQYFQTTAAVTAANSVLKWLFLQWFLWSTRDGCCRLQRLICCKIMRDYSHWETCAIILPLSLLKIYWPDGHPSGSKPVQKCRHF